MNLVPYPILNQFDMLLSTSTQGDRHILTNNAEKKRSESTAAEQSQVTKVRSKPMKNTALSKILKSPFLFCKFCLFARTQTFSRHLYNYEEPRLSLSFANKLNRLHKL